MPNTPLFHGRNDDVTPPLRVQDGFAIFADTIRNCVQTFHYLEKARLPAEFVFGPWRIVEIKRAPIHQRVVRAKGRQTQAALVRFIKADGRGDSGTSFTLRAGFGVGAQMFQHFAHGAEAVGAAIVGRPRPGRAAGENAGVRQIIGMHELIDIIAAGPSTGTL